jgi:cell division protein ZapD
VKKKTTYEYPLNERIRNLLRLEHLFAGIIYRLKGPAEWDSRAVIHTFIEILDYLGRIDWVVNQLEKDLKCHTDNLQHWQRTPNVDTEQLTKLLNQTKTQIKQLKQMDQQLGESFSQHQLLNLVRQRSSITGGTSGSDLPGYHYWLQKNPKQRQNDLNDWISPLRPLYEALNLDLYLIRNNCLLSPEIASGGIYQSKLDTNAQYQIIQITLPFEHPCYPEIKGSKQRLTIRFLEPDHIEVLPKLTEQDVHFQLGCCMI